MINAVVYNSLTGSCEKYAKLISAALHVPAVPAGGYVRSGGKVIYIGWARAGSIYGYAAAAKKYNIAAAVLVSMSPASEKNIASARKADKIGDEVKVFNVQGAFHMDKLPAPYKLVMKAINKAIAKRIQGLDCPTEAELATLRMALDGQGEPANWDIDEIVSWAKT